MKTDACLAWLDDAAMRSRLGTDEALMKRLTHDLMEEPSAAKVEKAFLTMAKEKNACDIFRALIRALPDKKRIILNNTAAVFAKYSPAEDVSHIYPIVLEYRQTIETETCKT